MAANPALRNHDSRGAVDAKACSSRDKDLVGTSVTDQSNTLEQNTDTSNELREQEDAEEQDDNFRNRNLKQSSAAQGLQRLLEECPVEVIEFVTPDHSSSDKEDDSTNVVSGSDKEAAMEESPLSKHAADIATNQSPANSNEDPKNHSPPSLPRFKEPSTGMWTASHAANAPSEDKSASLVNILLQPHNEEHSLVRLSLWSVIDGHGGGCVATYASEVLLPHVAASVSKSLNCSVVHCGECRVNGELRDADAIDFEGLLQSSHRSNPHSIHYRTPSEDDFNDTNDWETESFSVSMDGEQEEDQEGDQSDGEQEAEGDQSDSSEMSLASSLSLADDAAVCESFVKSSVKTASPMKQTGPAGTHSTGEVERVTNAVTESFCAVDEGWLNSIDVATTHQTSCETNGAWNAGACALVVFTLQRLEWTNSCVADGNNAKGTNDARGQQDAANNEESGVESETMEDEDEDRQRLETVHTCKYQTKSSFSQDGSLNTTPGGCECHCYRPLDAMLYTAHVGDCRAVLLGNAPPRTIKVRPDGSLSVVADEFDTTEETDSDEDSNDHSSHVTELLSSSDSDADSSDDEASFLENALSAAKTPPHMRYMTRPARRLRVTRESNRHKPFVALPPLDNKKEVSSSSDESSEDDLQPARKVPRKDPGNVGQGVENQQPLLDLSSLARSYDLTKDHSAYNPAEVAAVQRRSNNAPKAISSNREGGIRRVAGSLAVTRALGDAYLKTPLLSFHPYKRHAPYITARPEVSCRRLPMGGGDSKTDNVLILASDGVWERANGDDVLRWIRNYAAERMAAAKSKNKSGTEALSPESVPDENVGTPRKRKLRPSRQSRPSNIGNSSQSTPAELVVRRVLNKVRRSKNLSMQELLALQQGKSRRMKHDDITATVVNLGTFVG